jgi:hypothetical protein
MNRGMVADNKKIRRLVGRLAFLLPVMIMAGCGGGKDPFGPVLTPMSGAIRETITARAGGAGSEDVLKTAVAVATQKADEIHATQTAFAGLNDASRLATVTAVAPVAAELPRYGVDMSEGYVGWLHNPVTISLSGYMTNGYANDYPLVTAPDFVMAADIRMDSIGSMSGCGFMFRSNGDMDESDQYSVLITRAATGYLAFMATADGNVANFSYYFPHDIDKSFNWFNNEKNRLAIVVRGNLVDMYTNGHKIAAVDITLPPPTSVPPIPSMELPEGASEQQREDYQNLFGQYDSAFSTINSQMAFARANYAKDRAIYTDGMLGLIAFNESGNMTCAFDNAWLFILNK